LPEHKENKFHKVAEKNLKDMKNLSPEERIRRLKELAEKDEEEIKEAHELIRESQVELEEQDKTKRQIPIPQLRSIDVSSLFGKGTQEDHMYRLKHFKETRRDTEEEEISAKEVELEEAVARETPSQAAREEAARQQYMQQLSMAPARQLTKRMMSIYEQAIDKGYVSKDEMQEIYTISYALDEKKSDIKVGHYAADQKVKEEILISGNIMKALRDRYKGI